MNENNPVEAPYYDRSTGLVVFGILTIGLGCLCALLVPLMFLGAALSANTPGGPMPMSSLVPSVGMYAVLAVAFIWLGIGSIKARRWARALLLILSWSWLVIGFITVIGMAFLLPKIMANMPVPSTGTPGHPVVPPAALEIGMIIGLLFDSIIFVVVPAVWTFFYSSRHVRLTCEWRDPTPRWTDACPLPVLGLCVWLLYSGLMMLIMPMATRGVMPFFGMFLTGLPGVTFCLGSAALCIFAAGLLYRLDVRGWWLIVILFCAYLVSSVLTFAQHDIMEMYHLMDYPQAQLDQLEKLGLFKGHFMIWMTVSFMAPLFGYLLFVKTYFRRESGV